MKGIVFVCALFVVSCLAQDNSAVPFGRYAPGPIQTQGYDFVADMSTLTQPPPPRPPHNHTEKRAPHRPPTAPHPPNNSTNHTQPPPPPFYALEYVPFEGSASGVFYGGPVNSDGQYQFIINTSNCRALEDLGLHSGGDKRLYCVQLVLNNSTQNSSNGPHRNLRAYHARKPQAPAPQPQPQPQPQPPAFLWFNPSCVLLANTDLPGSTGSKLNYCGQLLQVPLHPPHGPNDGPHDGPNDGPHDGPDDGSNDGPANKPNKHHIVVTESEEDDPIEFGNTRFKKIW